MSRPSTRIGSKSSTNFGKSESNVLAARNCELSTVEDIVTVQLQTSGRTIRTVIHQISGTIQSAFRIHNHGANGVSSWLTASWRVLGLHLRYPSRHKFAMVPSSSVGPVEALPTGASPSFDSNMARMVESRDNKTEERPRNRLRKPPQHIVPRSTRGDYSWIFWDPTGDKQRRFKQERDESILRYVPRWMRSSAFGSADADINASHDVEAGDISEAIESGHTSSTGYRNTLSRLGRHWGQGRRRALRHSGSSDMENNIPDHCSEGQGPSMSVADRNTTDENITSVRMRKPIKRTGLEWKACSEEVERATNTQLLASPAARNLARLFEDPNGTANAGCIVQDRQPARRIRTWTYGLDRTQSHSTQSHSTPTTMTTIDDERCQQNEPTLIVPKTRREGRSTEDTTAAAEGMSMIDLSYGEMQRIEDAKMGMEEKGKDGMEDMSDADGFCSLLLSTVGDRIGPRRV